MRPGVFRPRGEMPFVEGFTPARAWAYLAALVVWAAGFLVVIVRFGGQEQASTVSHVRRRRQAAPATRVHCARTTVGNAA